MENNQGVDEGHHFHLLNYGVAALRGINKNITDGANGFDEVSHICEWNGRDNMDFVSWMDSVVFSSLRSGLDQPLKDKMLCMSKTC